jgi:ABC-type transport system involved in multi-copper enzyme maturation permease subunit
VPVIAAELISREREVGTLDCLFATPLSTEEIFTNKWQASVMGTGWGFVTLAGTASFRSSPSSSGSLFPAHSRCRPS